MTEIPLDLAVAAFHALGRSALESGPVLGALFTAGLVGGITHCAGMCGPFVVAQVTAGLERVPAQAMSEFRRLRGAALIPYHLGRATTYTVLGALSAGLTGRFVSLTGFRWLATVLLGAAATAFLFQGLSRGLGLWAGAGAGGSGGVGGRLAAAVSRLARPLLEGGRTGAGRYGLGVVLGFLPCGLLYGALAAAAGLGNWISGGLAMAAFAAGTVPGLVGVGLVGHLASRRGGVPIRVFAGVLMVVNAGALAYLAWRVVA